MRDGIGRHARRNAEKCHANNQFVNACVALTGGDTLCVGVSAARCRQRAGQAAEQKSSPRTFSTRFRPMQNVNPDSEPGGQALRDNSQ